MILDIKTPDLDSVRKRLGKLDDKAETAMRNAINRTIERMYTYIADEANDNLYLVKRKAIKSTLRRTKATKRNLSGAVISQAGERVPLIGFRVSPGSPNPAAGYAAFDAKGHGQSIEPQFYKSKVMSKTRPALMKGSDDRSPAFVARMSSGHVGIYERMLGKSRSSGNRVSRPGPARKTTDEKIAQLYGPSIPSMLGNDVIVRRVRDKGQQYLKERLDHEINHILEAGK